MVLTWWWMFRRDGQPLRNGERGRIFWLGSPLHSFSRYDPACVSSSIPPFCMSNSVDKKRPVPVPVVSAKSSPGTGQASVGNLRVSSLVMPALLRKCVNSVPCPLPPNERLCRLAGWKA